MKLDTNIYTNCLLSVQCQGSQPGPTERYPGDTILASIIDVASLIIIYFVTKLPFLNILISRGHLSC